MFFIFSLIFLSVTNSTNTSPGEQPPTPIGAFLMTIGGIFTIGIVVLPLCCMKVKEEQEDSIKNALLGLYVTPN